MGLPLAYVLARTQSRFKNVLIMLVVLPLFVGNAVRAAGWMVLKWFKKSRRVFWKSDNKLQFLFGLTKTASFWSRGFIGWKRAKRLGNEQSSDCWSQLRWRIRRHFHPKVQKQKQNARRWSD